jgi:basic membrane lipoprotein Med (substrate-binding protein (PBP1-ABC) superfamily)
MKPETAKRTALEWLEYEFVKLESTIGVHSSMYHLIEKAMVIEKGEMCDFADYVINRAKDFEAGDIDHREYEGSIDEMFERRYREGGTKLSPGERFWKEVDELRKERDEKIKESFKTNEK